MHNPTTENRFTNAWQENRRYLIDLSYRLLGDVGEAEDVVQEAFSRLAQAPDSTIEDDRGWLTVVTSRLCLDRIRSARSRHERADDGSIVESAAPLAQLAPMDPADRITLDDEVQTALLVVLERLSPAERVAFILHDVFQTPFDTIAETLGRPVATCRQLARRARLKIESASGQRVEIAAAEHRLVTAKFVAACSEGDLDSLLAVLHPQVWGIADFGPGSGIPRQDNRGAALVAELLLRFYGEQVTLVVREPASSDAIAATGSSGSDQSTLHAYLAHDLFAVMTLTIEQGLVKKIDAAGDPTTLALASARAQTPTLTLTPTPIEEA